VIVVAGALLLAGFSFQVPFQSREGLSQKASATKPTAIDTHKKALTKPTIDPLRNVVPSNGIVQKYKPLGMPRGYNCAHDGQKIARSTDPKARH
jgi:hypothetical protein